MRSVIEEVENEEVERGFEIGKFNSRGVMSRSLTEAVGKSSWLPTKYAGWAQISDRWPRAAAMIRRMEATYREEHHVRTRRAIS